MIRQEIRRVLLSPFFYLSIAIFTAGAFVPVVDGLPYSQDIVYFFDIVGLGYGKALTPILSTLTVADSYLIENQTGYHFAVMSRTTKWKYCLSKMGVAIFSGIAVVLIAKLIILAALVIIVQYMHGDFNFGATAEEWAGGTSMLLMQGKPGLYVAQIIFYDCMYAAVFPGLSLAVSVFIRNKYIVMLFPFIYANVTAFVFTGLHWYYLTPMVLDSEGRASLLPYEGLPYRIAVVLIYWTVSTFVFARGVRKQMK